MTLLCSVYHNGSDCIVPAERICCGYSWCGVHYAVHKMEADHD